MIDIIAIEVLQRKPSGPVLTGLSPGTSLENYYLRYAFETTVVLLSAFDTESLCNQASPCPPPPCALSVTAINVTTVGDLCFRCMIQRVLGTLSPGHTAGE
jgi:hypothetical protein